MQQEKNLYCKYVVTLCFQFCIDVMYRTDAASSFIKCVTCHLKWRTWGIRDIKPACLALQWPWWWEAVQFSPLSNLPGWGSLELFFGNIWGVLRVCGVLLCVGRPMVLCALQEMQLQFNTALAALHEQHCAHLVKAKTSNFFLISYGSVPDKSGIWYVESHSWGKAQFIGFSRAGFYLRHVTTAALCFNVTIS